MKQKRIDSVLLGCSIFAFFVMACSFLMMPFSGRSVSEAFSISPVLTGLIFWISLLLATVTQLVLAVRWRSWYSKRGKRKSVSQQKIGILSAFKNKYAVIADVFAILSLIGFIASIILTNGTGYVCYIFISVFVFAFSLRCILNGKVYYHITNHSKLLLAVEEEQTISSKRERK